MKIGIVVINWNGINLLKKYFRSIYQYSDNSNIYLIDNFSSDNSVSFIKKNYKKVKIIPLNKNYGFAEGYNKGLKYVKEDYICIINNDVKVSKGWLNPILEKLKKFPNTIIQPKILDAKKNSYFEYAGAAGGFIDKYGFPYCRGRIFNTIEEDNNQYKNSKIFWASGACMILSKKVYDEIGGFDNRFFAHMEEIDFCWRGFNLGYYCYSINSSKVFHQGAATIKKNQTKTYLNYRNSLMMLTKNLPLKKLPIIIFIRLLIDFLSSFRFIIKLDFSNFFAIYKAYLDYFIIMKDLLRERNNTTYKSKYFIISSIIYNYFILGKKKFFQLKYNNLP